jgi:GT2 family glycosyltransferase
MTARWVIPHSDQPLVSVLVVTFDGRQWVSRALDTLVRNTPDPYELIVVDNHSTDGTRELLRDELDGARVIELDENIGFGPGNDRAALEARAPLLCLLNSDALVPPGWFATMARGFDDSRVGAVVPAYVYPDGRLQEAGAIVESDGRVVALGVADDPDEERWRFSRVVPYGSAACMLIRRDSFEAAGGFDPAWGRAYYEDVDLAFRLRELGQSIRLDPDVRVVHAQGASSDSVEAARDLRDANQARFRSRWAARLWHRPTMFGARHGHRFVAARDCEAVDRILVIAGPTEVELAHGIRIAQALAPALDQGQVTVALPDPPDAATTNALRATGVEVIELVSPEDWSSWLPGRMFQFSAIVAGAAHRAAHAELFADTQPQAALASLPSAATIEDTHALEEWLLDLGLVPRCAVRPRATSR